MNKVHRLASNRLRSARRITTERNRRTYARRWFATATFELFHKQDRRKIRYLAMTYERLRNVKLSHNSAIRRAIEIVAASEGVKDKGLISLSVERAITASYDFGYANIA